MNTTIQKFILGMVGLGAAYLVFTHPTGFYTAAKGFEKAIGGTETQIITGGKAG